MKIRRQSRKNIRKKSRDAKLPLVDEVIKLDAEYRAAIGEASDLRANRNKLSKQIGALMGQAKKDPSKAAEAEEIKKQVTAQADRLKELEAKETELAGQDPGNHVHDPPDDRPQRAHRPR